MNVFHPRTYLNGFYSLFNRWQWTRDRFLHTAIANSLYGTNTPTIEIDCNNSIKAYEDCPHFRAVLDKKAEMFANGEWKCVSIEDETEEFPDDPGLALLNKPNPLQSREEFLFQASFYENLYANTFIYQLRGSALVLPKVLWYLPSDQIEILFKNIRTFYNQSKLEDIIDKFILNLGSEQVYYDVKSVMYKAKNFSFKHGKGLSRVGSLTLPINNLMASLKTRNVMTVNFGVKGFISSEGQNVVGPISIKDDQRKLIEKEFEKDSDLYSDGPKIKIVNVPTKFNQMSASMGDMKLNESEIADFKTICGSLGMRKDIFPFDDGATFENQIQAEKATYQSTIQPEADSFAAFMTEALSPQPGRKYILSYEWLPVMQADKKTAAEVEKIETETYALWLDNGIIDREAFSVLVGQALSGATSTKADSLGKIPLAIQQLALGRERANTAGDAALSASLGEAIDVLTRRLLESVFANEPPKNNS